MKKNLKNYIQVGIFCFLFVTFFLWSICKSDEKISLSERRPLKQLPDIQIAKLLDGSFMKDFDEYTVDQFPKRDTFRKLYSTTVKKIFCQTDIEGLYQKNNHIIAKEYPLNEISVQHASKVFQSIYNMYLKNSTGNLYFSVVPDKSFFLQDDTSYLTMDYKQMLQTLIQSNPQFSYIDIASKLSLKDYYTTDPHWKQEALLPVAKELGEKMGVSISDKYELKETNLPFYGTYAGQYAQSLKPDQINYLYNKALDDLEVYDHQNQKEIDVYNFDKLKDKDPYEFFLSGPLSYITIDNPKSDSQKELIVFRDSFTSPLAPLLATGYRKVTLLDIRYLPSRSLQQHIDFKDQDVLLLYSASVLNHSETLK